MTTAIADEVEELLRGPRPLSIVRAGHPVLRQRAAEYAGQLPQPLLEELIMAMRESMYAAPGVGLAAPQIGIGLRLAVIEDPADVDPDIAEARGRRPLPFQVIINPTYTGDGVDRAAFFEGCLSVPGYQAVVDRPASVVLESLDHQLRPRKQHFSGWSARIVQHETDHLNGTLYLDRADLHSLAATSV